MLTTPGPFLIEAQVEKNTNIYPVIKTGGSAGDQVFELPKNQE